MPLRSKQPARPAARSAGLPACLRPEHADGAVNRHAYTFCVLEQFWRHLKRRDVYKRQSTKWRNPQARLLEGGAWEAIRSDVLTTLGLPEDPGALLAEHAQTLDAAYREAGGRLAVNTEVRVDDAGKIHLTGVKAVEEPPSLVDLRGRTLAMNVVLAVLDLPVAAVVGEQVSWVRLLRGEAGDPVDGLGLADRVVVEIAGLAADADGLEHPGEVDVCDVAGGGDLADLGAAVAAVEGDVVRGQRLTRRGGARPARVPASAGCPSRLSTYSPPRSSSASMLPRCTGSAAAVMTVPVRSPLPSSVRCPATASSSGTTSG